MEFRVEDMDDGVTVVVLIGSLDFMTANDIDLEFTALAGQRDKVVVDLEQVSFMASLGVRTVIKAARTITRKGGVMVACNASEEVTEVLNYTGAVQLIDLFDDREAALASVR